MTGQIKILQFSAISDTLPASFYSFKVPNVFFSSSPPLAKHVLVNGPYNWYTTNLSVSSERWFFFGVMERWQRLNKRSRNTRQEEKSKGDKGGEGKEVRSNEGKVRYEANYQHLRAINEPSKRHIIGAHYRPKSPSLPPYTTKLGFQLALTVDSLSRGYCRV